MQEYWDGPGSCSTSLQKYPRILRKIIFFTRSLQSCRSRFLLSRRGFSLPERTGPCRLTTAAAVAFLIYAPFAFIQPLGDWLISVVVGQIAWVLTALHYQTALVAWDMLQRNGFRIEIILACTGIQAMAIMLGVASAVPSTTRQKVLSFLLVVPTIYVLNIIRNVAVIIAYTDQWFPYFPAIAGNGEYGYESLLLGP